MADEINIPENHQAFCRAVARLAREHDLTAFSGTFRPGFGDPWREAITFAWQQGRHGEDAGTISMASQMHVNTKIDDR